MAIDHFGTAVKSLKNGLKTWMSEKWKK